MYFRNFPERDQGNYILNGCRTLINYINIFFLYTRNGLGQKHPPPPIGHKPLNKKKPNNENKNSVSLTVWICKIFFVFVKKLFLEHFCQGAFVQGVGGGGGFCPVPTRNILTNKLITQIVYY